jgi:hypothetical protein
MPVAWRLAADEDFIALPQMLKARGPQQRPLAELEAHHGELAIADGTSGCGW